MPALARRRYCNRQTRAWRVYCGYVHVGTIAQCVGNAGAAAKSQWICGFYYPLKLQLNHRPQRGDRDSLRGSGFGVRLVEHLSFSLLAGFAFRIVDPARLDSLKIRRNHDRRVRHRRCGGHVLSLPSVPFSVDFSTWIADRDRR